jgi:hypothetical protein
MMMTTATDGTTDGQYNGGDKQFRCPYCTDDSQYTANTERDVRVHIASADDANHADREGFDAATRVEVIDADGTTEPLDDAGISVTPDDDRILELVDGLGEKAAQIVAVKYRHPQSDCEEVYNTLTERIDSEEDVPTKNYVKRTLRKHFRSGGERKSYDDLTPRQQRAIDAVVIATERSNLPIAEAADRIDEDSGYVYSIKSRYEHIIEARSREDVSDSVADALIETADNAEKEETSSISESSQEIDQQMQHLDTQQSSVEEKLAEYEELMTEIERLLRYNRNGLDDEMTVEELQNIIADWQGGDNVE